MSIVKKAVAVGLAVAAFAGVMSSFSPEAKADWRYDRWREHEYRVHHWRERPWGGNYYYGRRVYVRPPVVYAPRPVSPGINLLFNVR